MAIDTSGTWWTGEDFDDLAEYLRELDVEGYEIHDVRESVCAQCGGRTFGLRADRTEGGAHRTCRGCGHKQFIADSEDYWGVHATNLDVHLRWQGRKPCGRLLAVPAR
jgi:hypothetical protein